MIIQLHCLQSFQRENKDTCYLMSVLEYFANTTGQSGSLNNNINDQIQWECLIMYLNKPKVELKQGERVWECKQIGANSGRHRCWELNPNTITNSSSFRTHSFYTSALPHPEFRMMISPPRIHAPKSLFLKEIRVSMTAATRGRLGSAFWCGRNLKKQAREYAILLSTLWD